MVQREDELLRRHEPQIGLQTGPEPHARLALAARRDLLHARLRDKPLDDWRRFGRRHEKIQVADRLHPAAQTATGFHLTNAREFPQPFQDRSRRLPRVLPEMPTRVGLAVADTRKDALLRFVAKAVQRGDRTRRAGRPQFRNGVDAEFFLQRPGFLRADARNPQNLHQPRRHRRRQFLQKLQPARPVQLSDLLGQRLADTFHFLERAGLDPLPQLGLVQRFDDPGTGLVGADLEGVLALQLQQCADLGEDGGDLDFVHAGNTFGQD